MVTSDAQKKANQKWKEASKAIGSLIKSETDLMVEYRKN